MAKIHVEEDWSKEADENPFLSGGMINIEGYCSIKVYRRTVFL